MQAVPFTLTVQENTTQVTPVFSAPAGSFTSGQEVPITVDFGYPVILDADDTITVNKQELTPLETGVATTHVTYLYEMPEYGYSDLTLESAPPVVRGANDRDITVTWPAGSDGTHGKISDGTTKLEIPRLTDAVGQWTAKVEKFTYHPAQADQEAYTAAVVELTMDVPKDKSLRDLIGDVYNGEDGVTKYSANLALSLDGGKTLIPIQVVEENQMINRFDLERYIQQELDGKTPFADEAGEVRDGGVTLYAKAWVEGEGGELVEYVTSNNSASIKLESLLKQADGQHVTITSQLSQSETDGGSTVEVTLRNNSIVNSQNGNVIVTLLDGDGNVLEQQQSYTGSGTDNGLVALDPEARTTLPVFQLPRPAPPPWSPTPT